MKQDAARRASAEDLSSATGEPIERLRRFRSLKLIGSDGDERFAPEDIERVRLIRFLERRQIGLESIARAEHEEAILSSVVAFLFPDGVGRTYSFAEAMDIVELEPEVTRRLMEVSGAGTELMDEHDLQMLRVAKVALAAGFPETALLQLARVYEEALGRVAEAEVRLFHFYVHEGLKATGLSGRELVDSRKSVREHLLPVGRADDSLFPSSWHDEGGATRHGSASRERPRASGSDRLARPAAVGDRVPRHLELHADHRGHGRCGGGRDRGALL